jgi:hypothetical protein
MNWSQHSVTPGQVRHRRPGLVFLQDRDDLFFRIALALHFGTSLGQDYREIPHLTWLGLRGYGQTHRQFILSDN